MQQTSSFAAHDVPNVTFRTLNGERCTFCNHCGKEVWRNASGKWVHFE